MKFFSTRDHSRIVTASQAIAQGLSDEGGLFVPESFPQVDVEALCQLDYPELAAAVVSEYLTDYSKDFLAEAARTTYGEAFGGKAGYLAPVEGDTYALELWHGPTCAFKDYALQLMPKLLVEAKKNLSRTEKTLILVATSGDTGKAALDGYHDIPGVEIAVFYPTGGTSEIQRLQMATQEGANVAVYAVRGNFDDAQTGVKKVFGDKAIAARLAERNIRLSSANSINWGRLVPQIVYYFAAYAQLLKAGKIAFGDKVDFCVPTGNFGDILAGYYAKQMGLPVGKLVCASNQNNVLTDFLSTGTYTAKREFYKTTSPSMDILVSSNLERLLYHVTGSDAEVAGLMKSLSETNRWQGRSAPATRRTATSAIPIRRWLSMSPPRRSGTACRWWCFPPPRPSSSRAACWKLWATLPPRTTSRPCRRWKRLPAAPLPQVSPSCARRPSGSAPSSTRLRSRRWHWAVRLDENQNRSK